MESTDLILEALASPLRRRILLALRGGELPVGDLADRDVTGSAVAHALARLRLAELVESRPDGQRRLYSLAGRGEKAIQVLAMLDAD